MMRYDNRDGHKVRSGGAYVHVYAREGEDVRLDINFFDGDRSVSEAQALLDCIAGAVADAQEHVLPPQPDEILVDPLPQPLQKAPVDLTAEERSEWERLCAERTKFQDGAARCTERLRELYEVAFTRALRHGRWRIASQGGSMRALPADDATTKLLTRLGQDAVLSGWHDSLYIEGGGTGLTVDFDDGAVSVSLEFYTENPKRIESFCKALQVNIDLADWAAARRAEIVADLDGQIAALQAKRASFLKEGT